MVTPARRVKLSHACYPEINDGGGGLRGESVGGAMTRSNFLICMAIILMACSACLARAAQQSAQETDRQFPPLVHPDDPGLAVLVKKDGKILFAKGYGVR